MTASRTSPDAIAAAAIRTGETFRESVLIVFRGEQGATTFSYNGSPGFLPIGEDEWRDASAALESFYATAVDVARGPERFYPYLAGDMFPRTIAAAVLAVVAQTGAAAQTGVAAQTSPPDPKPRPDLVTQPYNQADVEFMATGTVAFVSMGLVASATIAGGSEGAVTGGRLARWIARCRSTSSATRSGDLTKPSVTRPPPPTRTLSPKNQ